MHLWIIPTDLILHIYYIVRVFLIFLLSYNTSGNFLSLSSCKLLTVFLKQLEVWYQPDKRIFMFLKCKVSEECGWTCWAVLRAHIIKHWRTHCPLSPLHFFFFVFRCSTFVLWFISQRAGMTFTVTHLQVSLLKYR